MLMGEVEKNVIIGVAIFLLLLFGLCILIYSNISNIVEISPAFKTTISRIPLLNKRLEETNIKANLENQLSLIEQEKEKIQLEWQNIEKAKQELKAFEDKLKKMEQDLENKKNEVNYSLQRLEDNLQNIKEIASYYELMEPKTAANILSEMDNALVIQIFKNMKKSSVSQILASMDSKKAGEITLIMSGIANTKE